MTTDTSNATIARLVEESRWLADALDRLNVSEDDFDKAIAILRADANQLEQLAREREADRKYIDMVEVNVKCYLAGRFADMPVDRAKQLVEKHTALLLPPRTTDLPQQAAQSGEEGTK